MILRTLKKLSKTVKTLNITTKNISKSTQTLKKSYVDLGLKPPKKLLENRATQKDLINYQSTLTKKLDSRIDKAPTKRKKSSNSLSSKIKQLNQLEQQRSKLIDKTLDGYPKEVIQDFKKGKTIKLGRGITTETSPIRKFTKENLTDYAELNGTSITQFIKDETTAIKEEMKNLNSSSNDEEMIDKMLDNIFGEDGQLISDNNKKSILNEFKHLDYLGRKKFFAIVDEMEQNSYFRAYKNSLLQTDGALLRNILNEKMTYSKKGQLVNYIRSI